MKVFTMISVFVLLAEFSFAGSAIQRPVKTADGYTNPNNREERSYDQYPGELIWHEFGRAYWRKGTMAKTTAPTPVVKKPMVMKKTVKRYDSDRDGVWDNVDQCANTPSGAKVNLFGCEKASVDLSVRFPSGKATINSDSTSQIDKLGMMLKKHKNLKVEIQGYTDSTGKKAYNMFISQKRAAAVRKYLMTEHGIESGRLMAKGYGPSNPIESNKTSMGRKKNRRVEAKVISN